MDELEIKAHAAPWHDAIELLVMKRKADGRRAVGVNLTMQVVESGAALNPTLSISHTAAQQLMDNLWQCGLRPTEGTGSAGALRAVERHLEDMRRLVFEVAPIATTTSGSDQQGGK